MQNQTHLSEPQIKIIKLQFQTPQQLSAFRKTVARPVSTDIVNLTVTCHCTDVDINLALKNFGATVIS